MAFSGSSAPGTVALPEKEVMLTRVASAPSTNWSISERANDFSSPMTPDMEPDTSSSSASSKNESHSGARGGEAGPSGGGGGGGDDGEMLTRELTVSAKHVGVIRAFL